MEETDQAKIKGNIQKECGTKWDKKQNQEKLKTINGTGKKKTVQRRYSQGHHQNQAAAVGPNTELLPKRKSKHSAHYMKKRVIQQNMCLR